MQEYSADHINRRDFLGALRVKCTTLTHCIYLSIWTSFLPIIFLKVEQFNSTTCWCVRRLLPRGEQCRPGSDAGDLGLHCLPWPVIIIIIIVFIIIIIIIIIIIYYFIYFIILCIIIIIVIITIIIIITGTTSTTTTTTTTTPTTTTTTTGINYYYCHHFRGEAYFRYCEQCFPRLDNSHAITKTRLFKYIKKNFTTKKGKISDKKFWYFLKFPLKT